MLERSIREHSATSEMLIWLCGEKKNWSDLITPDLLWAILAAALAIAAPMVLMPHGVGALLRPLRALHQEWVEERIERLTTALAKFRDAPRSLAACFGGAIVVQALLVAFYFAIFRARPSPFYVLDEVEAALDDVNLHRFLDLLDDAREHAQLLVVSHQRRTMEAADALYGVSMQAEGVSKVVSRRLRSGTVDENVNVVAAATR